MTPTALRCRLGEGNRGTAQVGWNLGISSSSGGSNSLFIYFLVTCGQGLFAGPASSRAALLALPQLALCCSLAGCPLPWQCPLLLYAYILYANIQTCCPRECLEQGRCCS